MYLHFGLKWSVPANVGRLQQWDAATGNVDQVCVEICPHHLFHSSLSVTCKCRYKLAVHIQITCAVCAIKNTIKKYCSPVNVSQTSSRFSWLFLTQIRFIHNLTYVVLRRLRRRRASGVSDLKNYVITFFLYFVTSSMTLNEEHMQNFKSVNSLVWTLQDSIIL